MQRKRHLERLSRESRMESERVHQTFQRMNVTAQYTSSFRRRVRLSMSSIFTILSIVTLTVVPPKMEKGKSFNLPSA